MLPVRTVDGVMVERRAATLSKRSIKTDMKAAGLRLALSMVDLTTLEGKDSPEKVRALCRKALAPQPDFPGEPLPPVAAVCVYPALVPVAKAVLAGSSVKIASVATAFPSGQYPEELRLDDVRRAVEAGADEIDMVINRGAFLAGRFPEVGESIVKVKQACNDAGGAHLKIILETGELETYDHVRRASDLAIAAAAEAPFGDVLEDGEVFIKTSTGKVSPAATLPVTIVMLHAIRDFHLATGIKVGMKPAGGIRTAKQALIYLVTLMEELDASWLTPSLFRFGASSLANDLIRQLRKLETGTYTGAGDVSEA